MLDWVTLHALWNLVHQDCASYTRVGVSCM